jgi:hypothetical protein
MQPGKPDASPDDTDDTKILSKPANKSTPSRVRAFLDAYAQTGRVNRACEIARITRKTHYRKLETDPVYRRAFEQMEQQVGQMLEDTAVERALAGDNHLLLALLKRFRADLYRERIEQQVGGELNMIVQRIQEGRKRLLEMRRDEIAAG